MNDVNSGFRILSRGRWATQNKNNVGKKRMVPRTPLRTYAVDMSSLVI